MIPLKVRSMVGLIPLFAVETLEPEMLERLPEFAGRLKWYPESSPGPGATWCRAGTNRARAIGVCSRCSAAAA